VAAAARAGPDAELRAHFISLKAVPQSGGHALAPELLMFLQVCLYCVCLRVWCIYIVFAYMSAKRARVHVYVCVVLAVVNKHE